MTDRKPRVPKYRLHRASGQGVVTLGGHDHYCGKFGTDEASQKYLRRVAEWATGGGLTATQSAPLRLTIDETILSYVTHAQVYYRHPDGSESRELETMRLAFRPLRRLYGDSLAAEFGPLRLKAVRQAMIEAGLSRKVVNQRVGYIKRLFKWVCSEQMLPAAVFQGLATVDGLRSGRSSARETQPVSSVPEEWVDAVLPHLPPVLQAMLTVQRLTGMRSGELARMTSGEIERTASRWIYRPTKHKCAHLGKRRQIPLGPKCQQVLQQYLVDPVDSTPIFRPKTAVVERWHIRRLHRRTPVQPSQENRSKQKPRKTAGQSYTTRSYYQAIQYAIDAAIRAGTLQSMQRWHPHQLRHNVAEKVACRYGLEAARRYLGHAKPDITAIYAGLDVETSLEIADEIA